MTTYTIVKTQAEDFKGKLIIIWNVIDNDNYVIDTFCLKRDAMAWIARSIK